jgi:DNA-binding transcriptional LysR family regulator
MVLACPPAHPLAALPAVRLAQLEGQKYVAFDHGLAIRREVDRFLRDHGVAVEPVLEFDNIETIKKGIEVGAGLALLPEPMLRQEVRRGSLRALPLEGCRFVRPLGIVHHRRRPPGSAVQDFIDLLRGNGAACRPLNGAAHADNGNGSHRTRRPRKRGR